MCIDFIAENFYVLANSHALLFELDKEILVEIIN